jgi:hypothetical protein
MRDNSKVREQLAEFLTSGALEGLRRRCLGPWEPRTVVQGLRVDQEVALRRDNLAEARYYQGKIDILKDLLNGKLVEEWIKEINEGA